MTTRSWLNRLAALALLVAAGCGGASAQKPRSALDELRERAPNSSDSELTARWLLSELTAENGNAERARAARRQLERLGGTGMYAELARGIDDLAHGRLRAAPERLLRAAQAARVSRDPNAELFAWFSTHQAMQHRSQDPELWKRWKPFVVDALRAPLALGWRARGELAEFWSEEEYAEARRDLEELTAREYGCVKNVRLAGPFGRAAAADAYRSHPAEQPGPWPQRWPKLPGRGHAPQIIETERHGCFITPENSFESGVYYAETYLELAEARELIIAVQGSLALWVDDVQVQNRDPRIWGVWPRFGVQVWLEPGRHRLLARLANPSTSVRISLPDGRPADVTSSDDPSRSYTLAPPRITGDPNVLSRYIGPEGARDAGDDLVRFVAAYLASVEGQGDVASVLHEPLIATPDRASGLSLSTAALYVEQDPLFDASQTKDLTRELHERAVRKDPQLWRSRLALALSHIERSGPSEAITELRTLVDQFPEVPSVLLALARVYGELGWNVEYTSTVRTLEQRFPDDIEVLHLALEVHDAQGRSKEADQLVERIRKLDPDDEVVLTRALSREDYPTALEELKRIAKRRPERKDVAERIFDVLVRAGQTSETFNKLEAAVEKQPRDPRPLLALADAHYASGKREALRRALVDAVERGVMAEPLKDALELVEGVSELEPYRLDARTVIKEWEQSGKELPGTAARILDYAAVWAHSDGSSRMLEHEVIRIQSAEAISRFAEYPKSDGLTLHLRVLKKDGRVLEPEEVPGKPSVTFPHLEIGDYIETERIITRPGDGQHGAEFVGPQWFFREESVAYARSEFVLVAPKDKPIVIETRGNLPAPTVQELPGVVVRRWRVDMSPAAPEEPSSAPVSEFLPSVRVGWGVTLDQRLASLSDTLAEITPSDPRVVRIARQIVKGVSEGDTLERARRLFGWVRSNVEHGEDTDGRRVVISKNGNRWRAYTTLCRALGIPARFAVARNRLASPPVGALSESSLFNEPLLVVGDMQGKHAWVTFEPPVPSNPASARNLPFGYVPADVRGMPAYLLEHGKRHSIQVPDGGSPDGVAFDGTVQLLTDGSARVELSQTYLGKYAMQLRTGITELPQAQLRDVLESRLLGQSLRGARLLDYKVDYLDNVDRPLVIRMRASVPAFAQVSGSRLTVEPPLMPRLTSLARLPERQTPLLIGTATHQELRLAIQLPPGAQVENTFGSAKVSDRDRVVTVVDKLDGATVRLHRVIDLPAGRVQPEQYPAFVNFARRADNLLSQSIRIRLASAGAR